MIAYTAQDWKYAGWIYNVTAGKWERIEETVPGPDHEVPNTVTTYPAALEAGKGLSLRAVELTQVPDPGTPEFHHHEHNYLRRTLSIY